MDPAARQAQAALLAGDLVGALKAWDALLARQPASVEAWVGKAEVLQLLGESDRAREAALEALALNPDLAEMRALVGDVVIPPPRAVPPPTVAGPAIGGKVPIVRQMGPSFTGIGIALALINFLCLVGAIVVMARVWPAFSKDPEGLRSNPEKMSALLGSEFSALMMLSLGVWLATLTWLTLDIADRDGPWGWMVAGALFGVMCLFAPYGGPGWFLLPLYFLFGRRRA